MDPGLGIVVVRLKRIGANFLVLSNRVVILNRWQSWPTTPTTLTTTTTAAASCVDGSIRIRKHSQQETLWRNTKKITKLPVKTIKMSLRSTKNWLEWKNEMETIYFVKVFLTFNHFLLDALKRNCRIYHFWNLDFSTTISQVMKTGLVRICFRVSLRLLKAGK
jgi:hypothetical protein